MLLCYLSAMAWTAGVPTSPGACLLPHIGGGPDIIEHDDIFLAPLKLGKEQHSALLQAPLQKATPSHHPLASSVRSAQTRHRRTSAPALRLTGSEEEVAGPPPAQSIRMEKKAALIAAAAACNRGFGATRSDRERIAGLFDALEKLSPVACPSAGLENGEAATVAPLAGCWRLIYTTANDVLSLDASPVAGVGAVYQLIEPPLAVTNIIDVYPRPAALLPVGTLTSALRLRVMTRSIARSATRVGLTFFAARAEPRALLGFDVSSLLPAFGGPIPRLPGGIGTDPDAETSPSFFDVVYVATCLTQWPYFTDRVHALGVLQVRRRRDAPHPSELAGRSFRGGAGRCCRARLEPAMRPLC